MFQIDASNLTFNLERASILLLDGSPTGMAILAGILSGFGARRMHKAETVSDARAVVQRTPLDLVIVDPGGLGREGFDFVPWLRRQASSPNRFASVLLVTAHTPVSRAAAVRDSGADFIVAKPLTPSIVYERLHWMARDRRVHVDGKIYSGPDGRFSLSGTPARTGGRRGDEFAGGIGAASRPDFGPVAINAIAQPGRAAR